MKTVAFFTPGFPPCGNAVGYATLLDGADVLMIHARVLVTSDIHSGGGVVEIVNALMGPHEIQPFRVPTRRCGNTYLIRLQLAGGEKGVHERVAAWLSLVLIWFAHSPPRLNKSRWVWCAVCVRLRRDPRHDDGRLPYEEALPIGRSAL